MSRSVDEINEVVGQALSRILGEEGEVLVKWLAVVEVVDSDGERALRTIAPEEQRAWDSLGLLRFADHMEAAGLLHDEVDGHE